MSSRRFLFFTWLTVMLLFGAACGGGAGTGGQAEETTPTTAADTTATTAAGATTTAAEGATGEFAGTIVLGAAVSETGKYSREGKDTRQGYQTWLEWVNGEYGGIDVGGERYEVELIMYDDEGDPDTAANLVERLITDDQVDFLLGPYSSSLTASTSAIAERYEIIMVEGNGASADLFTRGFKNLFAVLTPAPDYTGSGLEALANAGAQSVAVAYEDTTFPASVAQGAIAHAERLGLEVVGEETYPEGVTDVSAIMTRFRDLQPDVFVGGGHFNDAVLFIRGAKELGFSPKAMLITVGPSNPELVQEVGADADHVLGPTQWEAVMEYEDEWFGTAEEFAQRYEERWGEPPTYQAAESAATPLALQIAIEQAGSLEMDAVRQALLDMDVVTFYGPINFDETGANVGKPMGTIQIQDGEIQVVAPEDVAVAELQYPMPAWDER